MNVSVGQKQLGQHKVLGLEVLDLDKSLLNGGFKLK